MTRRAWLLAVVAVAALVAVAPAASAASTTFEDGFEDGDISEWSGETGGFDVQSSTVFAGSYALEGSGGVGGNTISRSIPQNTYRNLSVWVKGGSGGSQLPSISWRNGSDLVMNVFVEDDYIHVVQSDGTEVNTSIAYDFSGWVQWNLAPDPSTDTATLYVKDANRNVVASYEGLTFGPDAVDGVRVASEELYTVYYDNIKATGTLNGSDFITLRNASSPGTLVKTTTTLEIFLPDGTVVTRTTSDGSVNVSDLAINGSVAIRVEDTTDYQGRLVRLRDPSMQNDIYLLPDGTATQSPTFRLTDYGGRFPDSETVLLLQRPIQDEWQTVAGDKIGPTGSVTLTVRDGARYRVVLYNVDTGATKTLSPYTATSSGTFTITILSTGAVQLDRRGLAVDVQPGARTVPGGENVTVAAVWDNASAVADCSLTLYHELNGTNTTLTTATATACDRLPATANLTNVTNGTLVAHVRYNTSAGVQFGQVVRYRVAAPGDRVTLLGGLGAVPGLLPAGHRPAFKAAVALLTTVVGTAAAGRGLASTEWVGVVGLVILAAWSILGWVGYDVVFAAALAVLVIAALRRGYA